MAEFWSHPLTVIIVGSLLVALIIGFATLIMQQLKKVLYRVELTRIEVISMDYALEKSLPKNGYSDYRAEKKTELIKNSDFINHK